MSRATVDASTYKAAQRHDWDAAAEGWRVWGEHLEGGFRPVGERLIQLAGIARGSRVLDIATGIGEPALTAAEVVAPDGTVIGTDIAPGMIAIARDRARDRELKNATFYEMDAEELDLPEGSFDAVLCRFGLMLLPDVDRALAACHRLLVPGGRIAASVWAPPERVPMASATFGAVARTLQLPPPAPGTPGVFALADAEALRRRFEAAAFTAVQTESLTVRFDFESLDEFLAYLQDVAAPIHNLLANQPPACRDDVWTAIADANRQFLDADGRLHLWGESIIVSGTR